MKITKGDLSIEFTVKELIDIEMQTNGGSGFQQLSKDVRQFLERLLRIYP